MEPTSTPLPIIEQLKQYVEIKIRLLKYEGIDQASGIIAEVIMDLIVVVLGLLTFIFFSLTLALFASYLLKSNWQGFGCITLLYTIVVICAKAMKLSLQNIFIRIFIRKAFRNQHFPDRQA